MKQNCCFLCIPDEIPCLFHSEIDKYSLRKQPYQPRSKQSSNALCHLPPTLVPLARRPIRPSLGHALLEARHLQPMMVIADGQNPDAILSSPGEGQHPWPWAWRWAAKPSIRVIGDQHPAKRLRVSLLYASGRTGSLDGPNATSHF